MEHAISGERAPFFQRVRLRLPTRRLGERRFEAFFRASPVPTYVWRRAGTDLLLHAHNAAADASSGGRASAYLGRRATDVYGEDEPEILDDLLRCLRERSTFGREMSYTIPGTEESYDLHVTYAFAPPDLVIVHLENVTEQRRDRAELERSVTELRRADRERRQLLRELVASQEQERKRIAEAVHDDTLQQLVALSLRLEALRDGFPGAAEDLERLQAMTRDAVGRLRHLAFALHPPSLESGGLVAAIRSLLEHIESESGIHCALIDELAEEPSSELRIHAYRVIQEALMNVRRHARATSVRVILRTAEGFLTVEVEDDGTGFEPGAAPADHFGLATMHQRADLLGGRFDVASHPGRGTIVRLELPLQSRRIGRP